MRVSFKNMAVFEIDRIIAPSGDAVSNTLCKQAGAMLEPKRQTHRRQVRLLLQKVGMFKLIRPLLWSMLE